MSPDPGPAGPVRSDMDFVLLSHPRSATSYLSHRVLSRHAKVRCLDELFARTRATLYFLEQAEIRFPDRARLTDVDYVLRYLRRCAQSARRLGNDDTVGFKLFPKNLSPAVLEAVLARSRVILLRRRNIEYAAISHAIAKATGQWNPKQKAAFEPFVLDIPGVFEFIRFYSQRLDDHLRFIRAKGVPVLELEYERLFRPETPGAIWRFLGVDEPARPIDMELNELNSAERYRQITNVTELREALMAGGYRDIMKR